MVTRKSTSRMFSIYIIIIFLLAGGLPQHAEALATASGDFLWAKGLSGTDGMGFSIATDSNNNVYTTGTFTGTIDFDPGPGEMMLTADNNNIFISKLDSNGNFLWVKTVGGIGSDNGRRIVIDSNGNIYTMGSFSGTVDFDPGIGITNLTSLNSLGVFISKLDVNGDFVWVKEMSLTPEQAYSFDIAVDLDSNVYTVGASSIFDHNIPIFNDIFVSKLDNNGDLLWEKSMGGEDDNGGRNIVVDTSGNIYITGTYSGIADFDPGVGIANLTSHGGTDIFVAKLDNNGGFIWAKSMSGINAENSTGIAVDTNDNLYIGGNYEGTVDFDPGIGTANLTSQGSFDNFVAKLDNNGNFLWAKSLGGTSHTVLEGVAIDISGNVYSTGSFTNTMDFDPGPGIFNLTAGGSVFVSKLDRNGNFVWAKNMGGMSQEYAKDIVIDSNGAVFTTGFYANTSDFDPGSGIFNLMGRGTFISKLDNSVIFADVLSSHWANGYIERLYNAGITDGCGMDMYCPDNAATRAQMAVFLLRGIHGANYTPPAINGNTGFTDVATDYWAAAWIKQLAAEAITSGCGNENYCPEQTVTRAQMAVFLLKAKHGSSYSPPAATGAFADVPLGYWADRWIEQLADEGVTSGCGGGNYCPDSPVTRAQMAVFLVKAFNLP